MNDFHCLADLRGLILHSYWSGVDPDATRSTLGAELRTPGHTLQNFISRYFLPMAGSCRLNEIIAVNDAGNVYRQRLFAGYKSRRKARTADPEEVAAINLAQQAVLRLLDCFGIVQVSVSGVEADDVIAYLVQHLPGSHAIHTVDGDLVQLVSDRTLVLRNGQPLTVFEDKGNVVAPEFVALYKSLVGDSSDSYPGIKGFGPAAWGKLADEYGDEGLLALIEDVSQQSFSNLLSVLSQEPGQHPLLTKLWEARSEWTTSWMLANLAPSLVDARYDGKFQRLRWHKRLPDPGKLAKLLTETACCDLYEDLKPYIPQRWIQDGRDFNEEEILREARELFAQSPFISFDIETSDKLQHAPFQQVASKPGSYVDVLASELTGAGLTFGRNLEYTFYFPFDHKDSANLAPGFLTSLLKCKPPGMPLVIQNVLFERSVLLRQLGFDIPDAHDTKIQASHVDENESKGLKDLAKRWLDYDQTRYNEVIEKGKTMSDYSVEHVFSYGADDPFVTAHLYDLFKLIQKIEGSWGFTKDNEFPALYVVSDSFLSGVTVDFEEMDRQRVDDRETYVKAIEAIRSALETNVTAEWSSHGAANLFGELRKELEAKASQEQWDDKQLQNELMALGNKCHEMATYKPYSLVPTEGDGCFTSKSIGEAAAIVGLDTPDDVFSKPVAKSRLTSWYLSQECRDDLSDDARKFLHLLRATGYQKDANPEATSAFLAFTSSLLWRNKAVDKQYAKEGTELNLGSPPQMMGLLYGLLNLPIRLRNFEVSDTRKALGLLEGSAQTDKDAIAMALAEDTGAKCSCSKAGTEEECEEGVCPEYDWRRGVLLNLQVAKSCMTRESLFYSRYPLWVHPLTGQVHPQIDLVGTDSRRPSGSSPNPLQWPKKGEGLKFRRCILPNAPRGHDLVVSIDWSSQELRVTAGRSKDREMLKVYGPGGDSSISLHTAVGAAIAGLPYDDFRTIMEDKGHKDSKRFKDLRGKAKNINFGGIYGIGPSKLARQLLVPSETANEWLQAKKELYSGVEEWRADVTRRLHANGYVSTLFGSRRHFYNRLNNPDSGLVGHMERSAVNYEIQGLCADVLKRTLRYLWERQVLRRYDACLIAPIYDEVVFSCYHTQAVGLILDTYEIMTMAVPGLGVDLPAAPSLGPNFGDQIEIMREEDIGRPPTKDEILSAIGKVLRGRDLQYWYHPESESLFACQPDGQGVHANLCLELDFEDYMLKLKEAA